MKKKNLIGLIVFVLVGAFLAYTLMADRAIERDGREKFANALSELRSAEPKFDNPCLGASVLRRFSYSELNAKSIAEIKELAKMDPGSC
jgi:hypothetical protein